MCGLVGYLGAGDCESGSAHRVGLMTKALAHRGPDASGVWVEGPSLWAPPPVDPRPEPRWGTADAFGVRTLRDAFNGEIYNHHELRQLLQSAKPPPLGAVTRTPRPCLPVSSTGGWPRHWSARKGCLPSRSGIARRGRYRWPGIEWGKSRSTGAGLGVILFSAPN